MVMTKTNQTRTRFSALSKLDECQEASNGIGTHKRRDEMGVLAKRSRGLDTAI